MAMSSQRALAILIGIILIASGIVYFFGIPGIFEVEKTPDNVWGVILLVGGGIITLFAALNEATEFVQKLFSRERKGLLSREKPYDFNGPSNPQNRLNVIANVREAWIKGVLEDNLQDVVRLELHLQEIPDVLMRPIIRLRYQANNERALSPGVSILQVFQESSQNLLILGAPGSGKTFTMLELARDLLNEAERDEHTPVPVVLNLPSWAKERPSLEDWIASEIYLQYQLAKRVTYAWLEHDQLCLLLDGLDEVTQEQQDACVEAINAFKIEYNCSIVVCSRTKDYTGLATRLNLSRAIEIQPLTETQIEEYLSKTELQLQAVLAALNHDAALRDLITTPLSLNVVTLAYRGTSVRELSRLETNETRRSHLFNTYIRRMFQHRPLPKNSSYSPRRALIWLAYLARQLMQRSQTTFFIEQLQWDWLPKVEQHGYRLSLGLVAGLIAGLIAGSVVGLAGRLVFGLRVGSIVGLVVGLVIGLGVGLVYWLNGRLKRQIHPVDRMYLRRPTQRQLAIGMVFGLVIGLGVGLAVGLGSGLVAGLVAGLASGLSYWLISILDDVLVRVESERRVEPNQGILRSLQNLPRYILVVGLAGGLVFGLVVGVGYGLVFRLIHRPVFVLGSGLVAGIVAGMVVGLGFGLLSDVGRAVISHYVLRWYIHRAGHLPLKLVPFLDAMSELLLLRRVGGGYIFIHRTLMERFASLSGEELHEMASGIEG
jgi:hypothetical protein